MRSGLLGIFYGLGKLSYRFRWGVIAAWAALVVFGALFAPGVSERLTAGGTAVPGSESEEVEGLLSGGFANSESNLVVVFSGNGLEAGSEGFRKAERSVLENVRKMPEVSGVRSYADNQSERFVSETGEESYAVIEFDVSQSETEGLVEEVRERVRSEALTTYVTGAAAVSADTNQATGEGIVQAEKYALPVALAILLVAFGSVVAAAIPILVGLLSVVVTLGVVYFLAGPLEMSTFVSNVVTMLGLALGIDYSLFGVGRFREELRENPVSEAVPRMVATAGHTIFASGAAVLIGLCGLFFFPLNILRSIGIGGVLVVFFSVAIATTLVPAVLGVLGQRIDLLRVPLIGRERRRRRELGSEEPGYGESRADSPRRGGFWRRLAGIVTRHPALTAILVLAILALPLYPLFNLDIGLAEARALPEQVESRAGDDVLRAEFDYPALNPVESVATVDGDPTGAENLVEIEELGTRIRETERVDDVTSMYTVGEQAARQYAREVSKAREEAEAEAGARTDELVDEQYQQLKEEQVQKAVEDQASQSEAAGGTLPPDAEEQIRSQAEPEVDQRLQEAGAREQIRAEVEREVQSRIDDRVPNLPEGVSAEAVTPEGVANFLDTDTARENGELQDAIQRLVSGQNTVIQAVTTDDPYVPAAHDAVESIRDIQTPAGIESFAVGGLSAQQLDTLDVLYGKSALYAAVFVLGASYLVLFLTFRSVLVPLKALLANSLSLAASFGLLVFIFQQGYFADALGFTALGFLDGLIPILIFCVVFGISMDYEVFMLSRMKEAHNEGKPSGEAVATGLETTGGVVAAAAGILISVTAAFAFTDILQIQTLGLGIALAVAIAAFLMQMAFTPAVLHALGSRVWWPGDRKGRPTRPTAKDKYG